MATLLYFRKTFPVPAVQWLTHGDHSAVSKLGAAHDPRIDGDDREIGLCQTHYGRKYIRSGDWIIWNRAGFIVAVMSDGEFKRDYQMFNAVENKGL